MNVKRRIIVTSTSVFAIAMVSLIIYFILSMTTMWFLPEGSLISTTQSPNGVYSINCYLIEEGATNAESIRAELVNHEKKLFKTKNIYWQYRTTSTDVEWISDSVVVINDIELEIKHDTYDYRNFIE